MKQNKSGEIAGKGSFGKEQDTKQLWIPARAQLHDHAMTLAGVPARKYYWDAKTFVDTCKAVSIYYGLDETNSAADVYNFEIEAMGGKMIYSDNAMPTIDFRDPLIKEPEDLHKLKTPDFYRDGRLHFMMDCIKLNKGPQGRFCGIFSMAVGMRSYPVLIKDMRKRPEFVHELFTFIIDQVLIPYFKVQREYCGVTDFYGADAWSNVPSLSLKELDEWVVPYNRKLMAKAREIGLTCASGVGEYCEEDPEKFDKKVVFKTFDNQMELRGGNRLSLGMGNWHNLPLETVREYTASYRAQGVKISINAGVSARILRDGPIDRIVGIVKRYIAALAQGHKLAIWLSNVPADTPSEHVHAAVAAAHTYGRQPIADNLDAIEFNLPQRETFQEWKRLQADNA